jgi:hypothetical protein
MRSVRLDEELERRLEEAARLSGVRVSELIRDAVRERCDSILGTRLSTRLADVIGRVAGGGCSSRRSGRAFLGTLKGRARRRRRKNP